MAAVLSMSLVLCISCRGKERDLSTETRKGGCKESRLHLPEPFSLLSVDEATLKEQSPVPMFQAPTREQVTIVPPIPEAFAGAPVHTFGAVSPLQGTLWRAGVLSAVQLRGATEEVKRELQEESIVKLHGSDVSGGIGESQQENLKPEPVPRRSSTPQPLLMRLRSGRTLPGPPQ